jgi:hypothetical protein
MGKAMKQQALMKTTLFGRKPVVAWKPASNTTVETACVVTLITP